MAWWSRKKKMKADIIETSETIEPKFKIEPLSEGCYSVYEKGIFEEWDWCGAYANLKDAEESVKRRLDFLHQYKEKQKRDIEFRAKNPTRYYS